MWFFCRLDDITDHFQLLLYFSKWLKHCSYINLVSEFLGRMIQLFSFSTLPTFFCSHVILCACVCVCVCARVCVCVYGHAHMHILTSRLLPECLKYWGTWTEDLFRHFALLLQVTTCYQQRIICWINNLLLENTIDLSFPSPGNLPNPGIKPESLTL